MYFSKVFCTIIAHSLKFGYSPSGLQELDDGQKHIIYLKPRLLRLALDLLNDTETDVISDHTPG